MAESHHGSTGSGSAGQHHRPDVLAGLPRGRFGGFTGDPWWLLNEATKWVIAGVVAVVGIGLLVTALPGRNRKNLS